MTIATLALFFFILAVLTVMITTLHARYEHVLEEIEDDERE